MAVQIISGTDEHSWRNVSQVDADRNTLCEPHPDKIWVDVREERGSIAVVAVGDSSRDAVYPPIQGGRTIHQTDLRFGAGLYLGNLCFLEMGIYAIGIAINDRKYRFPCVA
jgi:hypothetical protein